VTNSSVPDLIPYLLGLGRYAYRDGAIERYDRLHEAARGLATLEDGEGAALRLAATLSAVDRVLAALLVAAVRECVDATGSAVNLSDDGDHRPPLADDLWPRLSDEAYFTAARSQGRLGDFLCFWDWFIIPAESGLADAAERHRLVGAYLRGLPEGDERAGVRLAILSLFDASEEQAAMALAFCNNLRLQEGEDALCGRAAERLLWAAESGELGRYRNEYVDLAAQVAAALDRWGVDAALPFLRELLRHPPTSFSPLARAHLRRAVLQLESGRE